MGGPIKCPHCHKPIEIPASSVGRPFGCPSCAQVFYPTQASGSARGGSSKSSGLPSRWLLVIPAVVLVLAIVVTAVLMVRGCGKAEPTPVAEKPANEAPPEPKPKPAAPQAIRIAPIQAAALDAGGSAQVDFTVERNGIEGTIYVKVEGAPQGITLTFDPIPADQTAGKIELAAAEQLGEQELKAKLTVWCKVADSETSQPFDLTVRKLTLPSFKPVQAVLLQPGTTATAKLTVERNGVKGPLVMRVENLPEKVTGKISDIAEGESETRLELAAAADAPDAKPSIRVATTFLGRTVTLDVPVRINKRPYQVKSFRVVKLKPGETQRVTIPIERSSYQGEIDLETLNLPEGVTVANVKVAANQKSAVLDFKVAADAKPRVRSATLRSKAGSLTREDPLVVRVSRGEGSFLPEDIASHPNLSALLRRGGFGGRLTAELKRTLLEAYGGTEESEAAVLGGLKWLASHQQIDGRWPLKEYSRGITYCDCWSEFESEVVDSDSAGTAFGLLPFLGAGVAHNRAPEYPPQLEHFQENVQKGLEALIRTQVKTGDEKKIGYLGGNMYAHAIGTMALAEAYGLSGDEDLKVPAQRAIKYLVESQHSTGGGWRYSPGQAGDMSATGWVFLAIRYGQLAGLVIRPTPLSRAERFLDACAAGPEEAKLSRYSYTPGSDAKLSLSAAGLLTREYLGWKKDNPDLQAGVKYLMQNLPPESSDKVGHLYYYYYATQVLHHMEGSEFDLWNHRMREHLIRLQEREGHQAGSWNPEGATYGNRGGRLYTTAMAIMTLQVYYRHLPMYRAVSRRGR
ncbi:MAG: hypothetical protein ACC628_25195 [Pirellulaceae bacterium]